MSSSERSSRKSVTVLLASRCLQGLVILSIHLTGIPYAGGSTLCLCPCCKALYGKPAKIRVSTLELVQPIAKLRTCHQSLVRCPVQSFKIRLSKLWSVRVRNPNVVLDVAVMSRSRIILRPIEYFRHKAYTTRTRTSNEAIGPLTGYALSSMECPAINYSKSR